MYAREVNGRTLEFGVSGKLYRNGLIMFDRQTGSEWSHVTGGAITGPHRGTKLTPIAALQTSWREWRGLYPRTLVLSKARGPYGEEVYATDLYGDYYASDTPGIREPTAADPRLPPKTLVLGVLARGQAKAYPFADLRSSPLVSDSIGGAPVLVVAQRIYLPELDLALDTVTALAYSRAVEGRVLTFQLAGDGPVLRDAETGSTWRGLTGEAIEGPLRGQRLQRLTSTTAFWFAWRDYFPRTALHQRAAGGR